MGWSKIRDSITKPVKDVLDIVPDEVKDLASVVNPVWGLQMYGEDIAGMVSSFADDPFGQRESADRASQIAEMSAQQGIASLLEQQAQIEELYKPYYERGMEGLKTLESMALGDYQAEPSKLYEYQKEIGERNIRRRQASKGQLQSTGTEQRLADFYQDLSTEEMERQYEGALMNVQIGAGAANRITAGSTSMAGGVGSLYQTLGERQAQISQGYGQSRQALYQTAANTMQNLGLYMAMK